MLKLLVLKWTHVDLPCRSHSYEPYVGGTTVQNQKESLFQNPNGDLIMEDSWMYGCIDDAIVFRAAVSVLCVTHLKCGYCGDV